MLLLKWWVLCFKHNLNLGGGGNRTSDECHNFAVISAFYSSVFFSVCLIKYIFITRVLSCSLVISYPCSIEKTWVSHCLTFKKKSLPYKDVFFTSVNWPQQLLALDQQLPPICQEWELELQGVRACSPECLMHLTMDCTMNCLRTGFTYIVSCSNHWDLSIFITPGP